VALLAFSLGLLPFAFRVLKGYLAFPSEGIIVYFFPFGFLRLRTGRPVFLAAALAAFLPADV